MARSGMATTEMRIVLINLIDATLIVHPMVVITVYVDDISAEMTGPDKHIEKELGDCILEIADALIANHQTLSNTTCVCTVSTDTLGKTLELRSPPPSRLNTPPRFPAPLCCPGFYTKARVRRFR